MEEQILEELKKISRYLAQISAKMDSSRDLAKVQTSPSDIKSQIERARADAMAKFKETPKILERNNAAD